MDDWFSFGLGDVFRLAQTEPSRHSLQKLIPLFISQLKGVFHFVISRIKNTLKPFNNSTQLTFKQAEESIFIQKIIKMDVEIQSNNSLQDTQIIQQQELQETQEEQHIRILEPEPEQSNTIQKYDEGREKVSTPELNEEANLNYDNQFVPSFENDIKRRLRVAFEYYTHKQSATTGSPTFQQIQHKLNVMNLTKWMLFCKSFQLSKFLVVMELHNLFKKYSVHDQMDFDVFQKALMVILNSSGPFQKNLKHLSIDTEDSWLKKMNSLDIPYMSPKKNDFSVFQSSNRMPGKPKSRKQAKRLETETCNKKNISDDKFNMKKICFEDIRNMVLPVSVVIEDDEDDKKYLKEFKIQFPKATQNRSKKMMSYNQVSRMGKQPIKQDVTLKTRAITKLPPHQKYFENPKELKKSEQISLQNGLLKRLDERMNKFSRRC